MFNLAFEKFLVLWLLGEIEHTDKAVICNWKVCLKDILVIWWTVGSLNIFQPFFILLLLFAKSLLFFILKLFSDDFFVFTIFSLEPVIMFFVFFFNWFDCFVKSAFIICRLCNGNFDREAFKLLNFICQLEIFVLFNIELALFWSFRLLFVFVGVFLSVIELSAIVNALVGCLLFFVLQPVNFGF